jgi:GT2 family glycosyltransferase
MSHVWKHEFPDKQDRQNAALSSRLIEIDSRTTERLKERVQEQAKTIIRIQSGFDEQTAMVEQLNAHIIKLKTTVEEQKNEIDWLVTLSRHSTLKRLRLLYALAPLDLSIGFILTATELLGRLIKAISPQKPPCWPLPDTTRCSIIVLSWEGKSLLAESLPALIRAVENDGGDHEIIVLDNGSTDGTEEYVRQNFPIVRIIRSPENVFFSSGNNLGVQAATRDIVVLLNNDMIVEPGFLKDLLSGFKEPDVFAVASQIFLDPSKRREETGKTRGIFKKGELIVSHESILPTDIQQNHIPIFYAGGGAAAFDRRKYLWLGGLDTIWEPFYYEDTGISQRAWKAGWKCYLAANSHVFHKHRSSTLRWGKDFVENIIRRNSYLFLWKNINDLSMIWSHILRLPKTRIMHAAKPWAGVKYELRAYFSALSRLPRALSRRLLSQRKFVRSDKEVFNLLNRPANPGNRTDSLSGDKKQKDSSQYIPALEK